MEKGHNIPAAFALLATESNHAADAALLEVLPGLEETARTAAVDLLVSRAHGPTLLGLIEGFPAFDEHLKGLLAGQVGVLLQSLRTTSRSTASTTNRGAVELITHSRSGEFAYLLVETMFGPCPDSANHAAEGLRVLGAYYLGRRSGHPPGDRAEHANRRGFEEFLESLGRTVSGWERHNNARSLETVLWFDTVAAPVIKQKLNEPRTTIAKAIRSLLLDQASPRLAGFTLRALGIPALRNAAAKAIRSKSNPSYRLAILARASLAEIPEIRQGCRYVGLAQVWLEDIAAFDNLSAKAAQGIVSLITSFCAREAEGISLARRMVDGGQPAISRAALSFLCRTTNDHSSEALQSLACREDSATSAKAANEIRRRVGRSSQDRPRREPPTASEDGLAPRRAFERYWHEHDRLDGTQLQELARAMRPLARYLLPALRTKLADSQPFLKVRALRTAKWLGVTSEIIEQVYGTCVHMSPVARSYAVRMLGQLPGATSIRILRRAIDDPDDRVQANAIEAIDELKMDEKGQLVLPRLQSTDPRVRGTAIKTLLSDGHPEAGASLIDMLESGDGRQKRTALWIVSSLKLVAVSSRVRKLSEGSQDPRIQKTASAVMHKLNGSTHDTLLGSHAMVNASMYGANG